VARDRLTDLAVITAPIPAGAVRPATLGDASALKAGDHVVAVGYTRYFPTPPTQRIGVYGGRDADVVDMLRTETFILPGDSGGPLFDLRGNLIGINSSIRLSRRASQPIVGMSIDAALAAPIVAELIEKGRIARPFLGVSTVSLTPALAGSTGLRTNNGALVTAVTPGSPAARAGIRADEAIVSIGGQPVRSTRELASQLTRHRVDEEVAVGLIGPAGPRSVRARLAETPV
jgi:S1-C subfamily serine protease